MAARLGSVPRVSAPGVAMPYTKPGPSKGAMPKKKKTATPWRPAAPFNPPLRS